MKAILAFSPVLAAFALASFPAQAACNVCVPETKVPSVSQPGQYDYHLSCIEDESGDELLWNLTAPDDPTAVAIAVDRCGPHH